MLRECRRVLKKGGRLVVVTIEIAEGLGVAQRARAIQLGPEDLGTGGPLRDLVAQSGFEVVIERDLTEDFRVSLLDRLDALDQNDAELRRAEGHEMVDTERQKRTDMLTAVQEGMLRRTALVGLAS
ncbi:MAG TPA: hypothetical protein DCY33_04700 [Gemmatimonadetes bacterium]|nr:hypothetical protein [Gemmatimonadota bacterium]